MILSKPLLLLSALAASAFAHPGHSDELSDHAWRELVRRQDIARRTCSSHMEARREPAVERIHARRAAILAGEVAPNMLVDRQASGQGTTSYKATATAASSLLSTFPSGTATAQLASQTTQPASSGCVLSPETVVGPYYIIGEDIRSNLITTGQKGVPFYAEFAVYDINTCEPLKNAAVDIWSCNATGEYSGFVSTDSSNYDKTQYNGEIAHLGDKNDAGSTITDSSTALRGQQLTNSDGLAQFTTLLPGWYSGRTVHIHVRVHVGGSVTANGTYIGGNLTHTGQTFFGEDMYETMQGIWPYTQNTVVRLANTGDSIYTGSGGSETQWTLYYVVAGDLSKGVMGHINLFVDPTATNEGLDNATGGGPGATTTTTKATTTTKSSTTTTKMSTTTTTTKATTSITTSKASSSSSTSKTSSTTTKTSTTTSSTATVAGYGQCGGQNWTGGTTCVSGYTCVYQNAYYSQCVPS